MPYLAIFGLEFENNIVIFEISTLVFAKLQTFAEKQKYLNLGPKMPYLNIFDKKYLILVFSGYNLKKAIALFEFSTLEFVKLQNFGKK